MLFGLVKIFIYAYVIRIYTDSSYYGIGHVEEHFRLFYTAHKSWHLAEGK